MRPAGDVVDWQAGFTLALVAGMVASMVRGAAPDLVFLGGVAALMTTGILEPRVALAGFSNEGVLAVAALFVVAEGIRRTGALDWAARGVLGRPRSLAAAQLRMLTPVAVLSAFVNNTPIVAVATPIVADWGHRIGIPPSKLLLPLSYATILGGTCTLIGTSTNLVVDGLAMRRGLEIGFFEIAWIGVPVLAVGLLYLLLVSDALLPDRSAGPDERMDPRTYGVRVLVAPDSPASGRSIEELGLRRLPGLFLAEIDRDGRILPAVGPEMLLRTGDRLLFVGAVESVADLRRVRGLVVLSEDEAESDGRHAQGRHLFEVVIAHGSALVGRSVRDANVRGRFQAAVLSVHRRGERIPGRLGDVVLAAGDTLLLQADPSFLDRHGRDPDFALAAAVSGSDVPRYERAPIAAAILVVMVIAHAVFEVPLVTAALLACGALVLTGCLAGSECLQAIDLRVVVAIAASFAVGEALASTGVAAWIAELLVDSMPRAIGPLALVACVYVATAVLTELISNNAAAALMFPIAAETAAAAGLELLPFALLVMMAASASFATPIGYQTNLMVWTPGGYRFGDYLRLGIPLQLIAAGVTILLVTWCWL